MQVKKQICLCVSVTLSLSRTFSLSFPFEPTVFFFGHLFFPFFSLSLIFSRFLSLSKNILPENLFDYFINGSHGASEQYFLYESIISMLKLSNSPKKKSNKTRNTVSNAHKMIPPRSPMFCMAKSLFCSGKPQNHSNKNLK